LNAKELPTDDQNPVSQTDSIASLTQKGGKWIISASGGVQIDSWGIAAKKETAQAVDTARTQAAAKSDRWWWD
jgi:hypothetical protein